MMITTSQPSVTDSPPQAHLLPDEHLGARIGMWLFLFTELLLFGGLFLLYAVYRFKFQADFHFCAGTLDPFIGSVNTIILVTSSLTMVLAVTHFEAQNTKNSLILIGVTFFLGLLFLVNKGFEWADKYHHGLYPNSDILQQHMPGENIFYALYFLMTGLHGLHVLIGMVILSIMFYKISRELKLLSSQSQWDRNFIQLENSGLYWHMIDIVWIFLFPLFYLIS